MTEKATLNILNLVEHIQEDCVRVQGQLRQLAGGDGLQEEAAQTETQGTADLWTALLSQGDTLDRLIQEHFPQASSQEAAPPGIQPR